MISGVSRREAVAWLVAAAGLLAGGGIHLAIAPEHLAHAPAHGLFFGLLGALQILWLGALLILLAPPCWRRRRIFTALRLPGLMLSGGAVLLWILTQTLRPPFAEQPEPIDAATLWSKAIELLAAIALALAAPSPAGPRRRGLRRALLAAGGSAAAGLAFWGGGMLAESRWPSLRPEEGHDHSAHRHLFADAAPVPTFGEYLAAVRLLVGGLFETREYAWNLPADFPLPRVPEDNPMSAAKAELGRHLFYDARLSFNGRASCASCHRQERAFTDGRALAIGATGEEHPRNSMALVNVAYNATLTWAHPSLERIEEQLQTPLFGSHPVELGIAGHEKEVLARFAGDARYRELFAAAFPESEDPFSWPNVLRALASFTRILISADSPYDRFVRGDTGALSASAQRGLAMFLSEDFECHHCHGGFNFSSSSVHATTAFAEKVFHNTGLYDLGDGSYPNGNRGIFELSQRPEDMGRFRPPTLRNIAVTAPYMHDGSIATLEEVIETYAAGGRLVGAGPLAGDGRRNPFKSGFVPGFRLSRQERDDLVAFLRSLTDEAFLRDPRFSDPFDPASPSG